VKQESAKPEGWNKKTAINTRLPGGDEYGVEQKDRKKEKGETELRTLGSTKEFECRREIKKKGRIHGGKERRKSRGGPALQWLVLRFKKNVEIGENGRIGNPFRKQGNRDKRKKNQGKSSRNRKIKG